MSLFGQQIKNEKGVSKFQPCSGRFSGFSAVQRPSRVRAPADNSAVERPRSAAWADCPAKRYVHDIRPTSVHGTRKKIDASRFGVIKPFIPKVAAGGRTQGALVGQAPLPKERALFALPMKNYACSPKVPAFMVPREEAFRALPTYLRLSDGTWDTSDLCDPPKQVPYEHAKALKTGVSMFAAEFGFENRWNSTTHDFRWPELPKDCRMGHPCWSLQYGLSPMYMQPPASVAPSDDYGGC